MSWNKRNNRNNMYGATIIKILLSTFLTLKFHCGHTSLYQTLYLMTIIN